MDSALTQIYGGSNNGGGFGGGIGAAVAAPVNAVAGASAGAAHLHLLGVLLFLIVIWALVRVAGYRFGVQVSTGVGR